MIKPLSSMTSFMVVSLFVTAEISVAIPSIATTPARPLLRRSGGGSAAAQGDGTSEGRALLSMRQTPPGSNTGPPWEVVKGDCKVEKESGCLISPNYPADYGNGQECVIRVYQASGPIRADDFEFNVESGDHLSVNNMSFSGTGDGLTGLVPSGQMKWSSDSSTADAGWRLCTDPPDTTALVKSAASAHAWRTTNGNCKKDNATGCISSPNYPANYGDAEECIIRVDSDEVAISEQGFAFQTESKDTLTVNGHTYYGDGSGLVGLRPTGQILWTSDATVSQAGWRLCLTHAPSLTKLDLNNSAGAEGYAIEDTNTDLIRVTFQIDNLDYDRLSARGQEDVKRVCVSALASGIAIDRTRFVIDLRDGEGTKPAVKENTAVDVAINLEVTADAAAKRYELENDVGGPIWMQVLGAVTRGLEALCNLTYQGAPTWPHEAIIGKLETHSPVIWDELTFKASRKGQLPTAVPPPIVMPTEPPPEMFAHVSFVFENVPYKKLTETQTKIIDQTVIDRFAEDFGVDKNRTTSLVSRSGSGADAFSRIDLLAPVPESKSPEDFAEWMGGLSGKEAISKITMDVGAIPAMPISSEDSEIEVVAHVVEIVVPASTTPPPEGSNRTTHRSFHGTFLLKNILWPLMPTKMKDDFIEKAEKVFARALKVGRSTVYVQGAHAETGDPGTLVDVEVTPPPYMDFHALLSKLTGNIGTQASLRFASAVARFEDVKETLLPGLAIKSPESVVSPTTMEVTLGPAPNRQVEISFDFDEWGALLVQGDLLLSFTTPTCASGVPSDVLGYVIRTALANFAGAPLDSVAVLLQGLGSAVTTATYMIRKMTPSMEAEDLIVALESVELSRVSKELNVDLRANPSTANLAEDCVATATALAALKHNTEPSYGHPGPILGSSNSPDAGTPPGAEVHRTAPVSIAGDLMMNFTGRCPTETAVPNATDKCPWRSGGATSMADVRYIVRSAIANYSKAHLERVNVTFQPQGPDVYNAQYTIETPEDEKHALATALSNMNLTSTLGAIYNALTNSGLISQAA